ncbi:SET and MYND domain-containing protein 4-like [Pollicipes pollicipes]|uniref:SET and MYND domain-containing protein 4-like n=1 Tax=Pollicipes pollicipes TaxID=41117 RepID=UPI001884A7EC|nr:SET and MYND domain-containing protein 4-like [Pollicipes pollicipes]
MDALAKSQRESGNKSFRAGRFCEALRPDSLCDMESALAAGYASERHHKLHVRRARCRLALGRPDSARSALVQYRAAVHDLHLGDMVRGKILSEADALEAAICRTAAAEPHPEGPDEPPGRPAVAANASLSGADDCVELRQTEKKGRHIVTSRMVPKGSVLFVEEPYICVLLPTRRLDHCHHCIKQTHALVPCSRCRDVGFCSAACRSAADAIYHAAECGHAIFLEAFGIGVQGRVTVMRCGCSRPDGDRYLAVFHLMHHLRECDEESAYHYSRAAWRS